MGFIVRVWNWLTGSSKENGSTKGHPDLNPLDVDKLTKELKIVEEAKRFGEAGLPVADAQVLTGTESAIVQVVEKTRQSYVDWSVRRLGIINEDLSRRNITQAINRAMQADREFERKASALLTEHESPLRSLGDSARKFRIELEAFQKNNGLTRDAHGPTSTGRFFRIALLLLMIVIEGMLNAGFFSQGLSTGLIGGFALAGGLAALNVLVAFFFGKMLVGNVCHNSTIRRVMGWASLFAAIILMMTIGLGIAHVRDCLTTGVADPTKVALQMLQENPFSLQDVFSWALFAISIAFGLCALFDGVFFDDLYPGYGSLSRSTQSAIDDYEDELNMLREELGKLKDEQLDVLDKVVQESQAEISVFKSLIEDKKAVASRLSNALRDVDNSLVALLHKYRNENELHRSSNIQRPAYFDTKPKLLPLKLPDFDTVVDEKALDEQHSLFRSLSGDIQILRASIQNAFNQQFDKLKPLDEHFPRQEVI
jgi:hypothetical protein